MLTKRERLNLSPTRAPRRVGCGGIAVGSPQDALIRVPTNAVSFPSARTMKRFPSRCGAIRRALYTQPDDAVDYAKFFSSSHDAVIHIYDEAGNVGSKTPEHAGDFKEP